MKSFGTNFINVLIWRKLSLFLVVALMINVLLPTSTLSQTTWVQKVSGGGLGNPFCVNPKNDNIIYGAVASPWVYITRDRGNTWQTFSYVTGGNQIKSIAVSARDTNLMLVAQEAGPPDRIMKTTDHGTTWVQTLAGDFYYWGVPLAYNPTPLNDTIYTMASRTVYRSTNFGSTWDSVRYDPFGTSNQGWEYALVRPDSTNILLVADNATGIWKSTNYGAAWRRVHIASSEVPAMSLTPGSPMIEYGARWSGGGGFVKSTDGGETWNYSTPLNGINMWGVSVSKTVPNYLITGTYGPPLSSNGGIYISRNGAATWERTYTGLVNALNYACLVLDTTSVFVLQGDGIFKLSFPTGTLTVMSPNGDEAWSIGTVHNITWAAANVSNVKLEYSTNNGSAWNTIVSSVPAYPTSYSWTIPNTPSTQCHVRVSDAIDSTVVDKSDTTFTIMVSGVTVVEPNGGEQLHAGDIQNISWTSTGITSLKLEFSIDDGANWILISPGVPAWVGSYAWKVPHTVSTMCRVKASDTENPPFYDTSDSVFSISSVVSFLSEMGFTNNSVVRDTLRFGESAGATDSLDPLMGEVELPPKPGADTFDVRWRVPGTLGTALDERDTISPFHVTAVFTAELQAGLGGYPLTLRWRPETLPAGEVLLEDELAGGGNFSIDMKVDSELVISNPAIASVRIIHNYIMSVPVTVRRDWNLVSLPVRVDDARKEVQFPTAKSPAYRFDRGYFVEDTLHFGTGYWLKFPSDQTLTLTGEPSTNDSVNVVRGWNIIGGLSLPVAVSDITSNPGGIVISSYFGYTKAYTSSDTLKPGSAYWVKVDQNGKLILISGTGAVPESK